MRGCVVAVQTAAHRRAACNMPAVNKYAVRPTAQDPCHRGMSCFYRVATLAVFGTFARDRSARRCLERQLHDFDVTHPQYVTDQTRAVEFACRIDCSQ